MSLLNEIEKFRVLNKLKSTYRATSVGDRKESSAEHTWSCLVLADMLFEEAEVPLDKLRVFELLLYHDVVEIEAGDTVLAPNSDRSRQKEKERVAAARLREKLPRESAKTFIERFAEFEECKTSEAKFAKAIDYLDAIVHEIDYKSDWKGWTREFLVTNKRHTFEPFPKLLALFDQIVDRLEKEGYFDQ